MLESLSEVYLKKAEQADYSNRISQAQKFKKQAIDYLSQALEIVKAHFAADSPHIKRIESNLKALKLNRDEDLSPPKTKP